MASTIRTLLLVISGTGTALFSAAFTASILNPGYVEAVAEAIIRLQVQRSVHEKIDALDAKFLSGKAVDLFKRQGEEIEIAKRQLKEKAPERIASVIAEMRNLDCQCRKKIEGTIREGIELRIATAAQAQDKLTAIIQTKYMEVADKLTREFRIFTCTNALVFALLGIGAFFKRGGGIHLIPAALVMVVAAVITGYLYLFNQNWLHTILFSDYVGFTYVVYLSIVFAFLCDILFNRARVTTEILNATFQAIVQQFAGRAVLKTSTPTGKFAPLRCAGTVLKRSPLLRWNSIPRLFLIALLFSQNLAWAEPSVQLVRVFKSERKLQLVAEGKVVNEFKVALGGNPKGHKQQEGDGKTPEGVYTLDYKKSDTAYHRAIHISYPNSADIASAKARGVSPGGSVMIHGQKNGLNWLSFISQRLDWTKGCIALNDADMDILWASVQEGTKIEIKP